MTPLLEVPDLVERLLSARGRERGRALSLLLEEARKCAEAGSPDKAAELLRTATAADLDYSSATRIARALRGLQPEVTKDLPPLRLAILGGWTTHQLVELVELFGFGHGCRVDTLEANYGVLRQELLDPGSATHRFRPRFLHLAPSWRDLAHVPLLQESTSRVDQSIEAEVSEWAGLWEIAYERLGCQVLLDNFVPPSWKALGNHERRQRGSLGAFIARVNQRLFDVAPDYVTIHDVADLAAHVGLYRWADERFYHYAKLPCDPECLVPYARSLASTIAAQVGLAKKCLVLDLDNTLWGGVVGDDELESLRVGQNDPESEAYAAFQRYLKRLRQRGILLAVCSANTEEVAKRVFREHPGMVLHLEDISCFVANWDDKAANIERIANELEIGLESMVFLDDDPVQRAAVRRRLPEVTVPEVAADPTGFVRALDQGLYFQTTHVAAEDLIRTEDYVARTKRKQLLSTTADLESFLQGLEMRARIRPLGPKNLARCAQLVNKTNQFNLTTRRRSPAELKEIAGSSDWVTRALSLKDRFGDSGIVSVLLVHRTGSIFEIDTWLMSCRVLRRGVEELLFNHLLTLAREEGISEIRGLYEPTAKNELVSRLYDRFGFSPSAAQGTTAVWTLAVDESTPFQITFVKVEDSR